jgi:hypothetical protein
MHELIDQVRVRFLRWLYEQNPAAAEAPCIETVLLRDSRLCGYRFTAGDARAEWILGDSTFEVRMPGRSATLMLGAETASSQRAA